MLGAEKDSGALGAIAKTTKLWWKKSKATLNKWKNIPWPWFGYQQSESKFYMERPKTEQSTQYWTTKLDDAHYLVSALMIKLH